MPAHDLVSRWRPWIVCLAASLFFFYEFIQGNMFASIANEVMRDFHVQADKMTYLSSIYYASNVLFLFFSGQILDRFSVKKTLLLAMLLCVSSTFVLALTHSFTVALWCRFVTGIGSAFCFLGPIRIASVWFMPKRMAFVTGVVVTMAMTGGMLAQYPLTKLVSWLGFRHSLFCVGWLGLFLWSIMWIFVEDRPKKQTKIATITCSFAARVQQTYLNPKILSAAMYTSLMNMSIAVFGAVMGSLYLMQRLDVTKEQAAMVNSMLFLGVILGGPLVGLFSDKLGQRLLPMKIGTIASMITLALILFADVSLGYMCVLFFLLGFFTSSQVIGYALVAESSSTLMTATALSVVSILTQAGYIFYQNIFSRLLLWYGDMHIVAGVPVYSLRDYQTAAMILPVGLLLAFVAMIPLKETYCRQEIR